MMQFEVMAVRSFKRKTDGGKFHKLLGIVDGDYAGQMTLDGAEADHLAEVLVPAAAQKGAYVVLGLAAGYVPDAEADKYKDDKGNIIQTSFAGRDAVHIIRPTKGGDNAWKLVSASERPKAVAAQTTEELNAALEGALAAM